MNEISKEIATVFLAGHSVDHFPSASQQEVLRLEVREGSDFKLAALNFVVHYLFLD